MLKPTINSGCPLNRVDTRLMTPGVSILEKRDRSIGAYRIVKGRIAGGDRTNPNIRKSQRDCKEKQEILGPCRINSGNIVKLEFCSSHKNHFTFHINFYIMCSFQADLRKVLKLI